MTDTERKLRLFVQHLTMERESLRRATRRLEDETLALRAELARQEQMTRTYMKDTVRGMEGQ